MSIPIVSTQAQQELEAKKTTGSPFFHLSTFALALAFLTALLWEWQAGQLQIALALLPAVVALIDQRFAKGRFETQSRIVNDYLSYLEKLPKAEFNPQKNLLDVELDNQRPSFYARLAAATLLSAVLEVPALLTLVQDGWAFPQDGHIKGGIDGLIWAGQGALLYVLWTMIWRISVNSLSSRFVTAAALRSAVGLLLGFLAGSVTLFAAGAQPVVYVLVGAFVPLAFDALRNRARQTLAPSSKATERLSLSLIDRIQEENVELLAEVGISEIEHLATTQPAELVVKTLYPLNRVIDWIDQAVLIGYLRDNVETARKYGIRGAIDLLVLYGEVADEPVEGIADKAEATLRKAADEMHMPYEALFMIARGLYSDRFVDILYRFWQGFGDDEAGKTQGPKTAASPA